MAVTREAEGTVLEMRWTVTARFHSHLPHASRSFALVKSTD